jgi:hypothetical protein
MKKVSRQSGKLLFVRKNENLGGKRARGSTIRRRTASVVLRPSTSNYDQELEVSASRKKNKKNKRKTKEIQKIAFLFKTKEGFTLFSF